MNKLHQKSFFFLIRTTILIQTTMKERWRRKFVVAWNFNIASHSWMRRNSFHVCFIETLIFKSVDEKISFSAMQSLKQTSILKTLDYSRLRLGGKFLEFFEHLFLDFLYFHASTLFSSFCSQRRLKFYAFKFMFEANFVDQCRKNAQ